MSEATVAAAPVEPPPPRPHHRRWPWRVAVLVIVVAAAVTALLVVDDDSRGDDTGYGPLEAGGSFGLAGPGITHDESDGIRTARLSSGGPAYALSELSNEGTRAVRVTGIDRNGEIRDARWAPLPFGTETVFDPPRWRPFPATVPPDGSIQLRLTIGRSTSCANIDPATGANFVYTGDYLVRWRSRDATHETFIHGDDVGEPLLLC